MAGLVVVVLPMMLLSPMLVLNQLLLAVQLPVIRKLWCYLVVLLLMFSCVCTIV